MFFSSVSQGWSREHGWWQELVFHDDDDVPVHLLCIFFRWNAEAPLPHVFWRRSPGGFPDAVWKGLCGNRTLRFCYTTRIPVDSRWGPADDNGGLMPPRVELADIAPCVGPEEIE